MIRGAVGSDRLPRVRLTVADREWPAVIDTGFNGDLELPRALASAVSAEYGGTIYSVLADGTRIFEEGYRVVFPFDGEPLPAVATFADVDELLIGTRLLRRHRLEIGFEMGTVPDRAREREARVMSAVGLLRERLRRFEFQPAFVELLGWNYAQGPG